MSVSDLLAYPRLVKSLARFLDKPLTLEQTKALIRQRLETREERLLHYVAHCIYDYPRSPYLPLLRQTCRRWSSPGGARRGVRCTRPWRCCMRSGVTGPGPRAISLDPSLCTRDRWRRAPPRWPSRRLA